ncbi:RNA polymerase sigma factor SigM [Nocardia stercoris]|uniref:RNA polymerase sigma factor SigM n=1 Tax=Nocardia stercoris TaxID=2483361 RepID=UPI001F167AE8
MLAAHVAGDPHAFAVLFRRHYHHLYQLALRSSYSPEDAADSVQDALLSAHRNAAGYRGDAEVRSWLHRIVVNACLDRIRRNRARPATSLFEESIDEPAAPRDEMSELETKLVVDRALFDLPPDQRAALVAVEMEQLSVAEAAELLGVPPGTVKSRCSRGRKRLQERLGSVRDRGNRS